MTDAADTGNSLVGHLKKVDPDKFMKSVRKHLAACCW